MFSNVLLLILTLEPPYEPWTIRPCVNNAEVNELKVTALIVNGTFALKEKRALA
jgi:hypothetical protein